MPRRVQIRAIYLEYFRAKSAGVHASGFDGRDHVSVIAGAVIFRTTERDTGIGRIEMDRNRGMEQRNVDVVRRISPECMVLLKADGSFPLAGPGKIALYGSGARRTIKGGGGSADVYVKSYPTIEDGLKHAGFTITTEDWMDAYAQVRVRAVQTFEAWLRDKIAQEGIGRLMENLSVVMPEPEYDIPLEGDGDTAVYVLSRYSVEGADRQDVPGDLRLTKTECRDILALSEKYRRFLLVLNTAGVVDLTPVAERVPNILLLSQTGSAIGDAFADVLLGRAYPSGKLAATWPSNFDMYAVGEFGNRTENRYREGIYVGYRYADSTGQIPLFPFGFGKGYTEFKIHGVRAELNQDTIEVEASVTNTGNFAGREVVQVYASLPEGRLDQPAQVLAGFCKTDELHPGETGTVEIAIPAASLSSSDVERQVRVLERGDIILRVGNSSRNTAPAAIVRVNEEIVTERISHVGGETDFEDFRPDDAQRMAAKRLFGEAPGDLPVLVLDASKVKEIKHILPQPSAEAVSLAESLTDQELSCLCMGDYEGEGSKSVIGDAAVTVTGAAGQTTRSLEDRGIRSLVMADGASGVRLPQRIGVDEQGSFAMDPETPPVTEEGNKRALIPENIMKALLAMGIVDGKKRHASSIREQNCTAIPCASALAQSWSEAVVRACAGVVASEMKQFGVQIWLAPSMNIQRNPLCGRNFEYYSEDPLLSGSMACAMTREIQRHKGLCVTVKHFLAYNQETNRFRTSSMVNERALRDIYARGFEKTVREAKPLAMMSSYNLLNGIHTSERKDLMEDLLREEWGYQGIVMSDFLNGDETEEDRKGPFRKFEAARSLRAGTDLIMPGGSAHFRNVARALEDGTLRRSDLVRNGARIIDLIWKITGNQNISL